MDIDFTTDHAINECTLACLAETCLNAGEPHHALQYLDTLIRHGSPRPWYYNRRAVAHSELREFDKAANDISNAIALDPDDATNYWLRGGFLLSHEVNTHGRITDHSHMETINSILQDYAQSLERDPARSAAWINLLEINVILRRWNDAIGHFGACRSYINRPDYRVIRAFLGCLALALAGDEILLDDSQHLDDMTIIVSPGTYRFSEIEALLDDLSTERYNPLRLARAMEVHSRFLEHFNDTSSNGY